MRFNSRPSVIKKWSTLRLIYWIRISIMWDENWNSYWIYYSIIILIHLCWRKIHKRTINHLEWKKNWNGTNITWLISIFVQYFLVILFADTFRQFNRYFCNYSALKNRPCLNDNWNVILTAIFYGLKSFQNKSHITIIAQTCITSEKEK
jgi:hypothetical protein